MNFSKYSLIIVKNLLDFVLNILFVSITNKNLNNLNEGINDFFKKVKTN